MILEKIIANGIWFHDSEYDDNKDILNELKQLLKNKEIARLSDYLGYEGNNEYYYVEMNNPRKFDWVYKGKGFYQLEPTVK